MKLSLSLIVAAVIVPSANGLLFRFIFGLFLQPLLDTACTLAQTSLKLENNTDCKCEGEYKGLGDGFEGNVKCTLKQSPCLIPPNLFCVKGNLGAGLTFGFIGGTGFKGNLTGCFNVASGLPANVSSIENFCLTFIPKKLKLGSCTAKIGAKDCTSCDICTSGTDFKFDCSNINLATPPFPKIPGPKITNCIGLGLVGALPLPNSTTRFF
jgi:hypothetical protein